MNILVIGGSYFLGKRFVELAKDKFDITVYNRGSHPLKLDGVREVIGDRHDKVALAKLNDRIYDAVIDFCAYEANDISLIYKVLHDKIKQYVFISTCDIYKKSLKGQIEEYASWETVYPCGKIGDYIKGKITLEKELRCTSKCYTVIRPSMIYGENNYAPRESMYFHWMNNEGCVYIPKDATGFSQLVYVDDVVKVIINTIGNDFAYNTAINVTPDELTTYDDFVNLLKSFTDKEIVVKEIPFNVILTKRLEFPFPLTKDMSPEYSGKKALLFLGEYTSLKDGLKKTYENYITK